VLSEAEAALKDVRDQMAKLAAPQSVRARWTRSLSSTPLPTITWMRPRRTWKKPPTSSARKHLVTLGAGNNLQVIPTPEFMRGVYSVAGFNAAPALEPQLGAFYWVTPIPPNMPKARVESKLREYNRYGLMQITIHEAMPGHYVQFEFANAVEPKIAARAPQHFRQWTLCRRLGALHAADDVGRRLPEQQPGTAADHDENNSCARSRMRFLDIRLQTMGMTEQQALDLMMNDTFQEKEEATGKFQRAQLSSCQLPMYFIGWRGWLDTREDYKKRKGAAFRIQQFHDAALKESAVPLPALGPLL